MGDIEKADPKRPDDVAVPVSCYVAAMFALIESCLFAMERPVTAWALGASYKSFLRNSHTPWLTAMVCSGSYNSWLHAIISLPAYDSGCRLGILHRRLACLRAAEK